MRALTVDPREAGSLRVETVADPEPGPNELLVSGMAIGVCGTDREIGEGPLEKVPEAGLRRIRRWAVVIVTSARSMLSSNGDSASAPEDFAGMTTTGRRCTARHEQLHGRLHHRQPVG